MNLIGAKRVTEEERKKKWRMNMNSMRGVLSLLHFMGGEKEE